MTLITLTTLSVSHGVTSLYRGKAKEILLIASVLLALPTLYDWYELEVYYTTDGLSDVLIILTAYLVPLAMVSNWNTIGERTYYELVLLLGAVILLNFMCQDMLAFYIYFEASLVPLFLMIGLYGAANREKAADYVLIYTLVSSLFMLVAFSLYEVMMSSTTYQEASMMVLSIDLQCILFLSISLGIMVKTPLAPLHTWLPVVHSESPLAGSILLAGVILKLAVYAIVRLILPSLTEAATLYTPVVYVVCLITIVYTSLITLRQTDMKVIVAYSSISHMAVCILGLLSNTVTGLTGSLVLSLAHGLVSPALFIIVGGVLYDRYHNRLVYYYQGLLGYMPVLATFLLVLSFANVGTPLTLNFIGELLSLSGAVARAPVLGALAIGSVLLSAAYQMKLTNRLTGGVKTPYIALTADCTRRERSILLLLTVPTVYLGVQPQALLDYLWDLSSLVYSS